MISTCRVAHTWCPHQVDAAKPLRHAVLVGDLATVQDYILKGADLEIAGNTKSFERDGRVIETSNIRRVRDTHNKDKVNQSAPIRTHQVHSSSFFLT